MIANSAPGQEVSTPNATPNDTNVVMAAESMPYSRVSTGRGMTP